MGERRCGIRSVYAAVRADSNCRILRLIASVCLTPPGAQLPYKMTCNELRIQRSGYYPERNLRLREAMYLVGLYTTRKL